MTMKRLTIAAALGSILCAEWCRAGETVFTVGETAASESFGAGEGIFWFIAAMLGTAAVYAMIALGRSIHRRAEAELNEVEQLIKEKG